MPTRRAHCVRGLELHPQERRPRPRAGLRRPGRCRQQQHEPETRKICRDLLSISAI